MRTYLSIYSRAFLLCQRQSMRDEDTITQYLIKMANEGKPMAMCKLGYLYLNPRAKDENEALKWLERASDAGEGLASRFLGDYHIHRSKGDTSKSQSYYQKSVDQGHVPAYVGLGVCQMSRGRYEEGILSIRKSLICGLQDNSTCKELGDAYRDGLITKDEYASTLRANQEAVSACKSKGRDEMKEIMRKTEYVTVTPDTPLPPSLRGLKPMTDEEFKERFKVVERP